MSEQLSWRRMLWLLRIDVVHNRRSWLIGLGTAALIALAVSVLGALDGAVGNTFYQAFFSAALFALGTLATSLSFVDMHGRSTNAGFLLLPASALEKALVRLVLTTVGVFAAVLVLTTVLSWLLEALNALLFDVRRETFLPTERLAWQLLPHYLVAQSVFFLGAAWFRKLHFVKTVGAVLLVAIGLGAIGALLIRLLSPAAESGPFVTDDPFDWLIETAPFVYYAVLPVFCWFVAWLRVREAQVSHGV